MPRQIIIAEQHRIAAVFSEDQIQELIVASGNHQVGDVYLGIVENVLPSIDAAFVNIGNSERNGFIHVTDLGPLRLKRSSASISELVSPQQKVLVQVMKEPTGNKGPRLTGNLSFPGRYLVLMPHGRGVHLSRRIRDDEERNRLKSLAILIKPAQTGLLVRTEAEDVSEEAMIEDLEQLKKQWEYIQQQQSSARSAGLLNRDDDFIQRVLRDVYSADVNRIVTDSQMGLKRVRQYLQSWNKGQMPPGVFVDAHREQPPILEYFRINAVIRQALRPRVDLPSGGYIVIEPTEALTVIDVNSGSFTQSATSRETVLWTNCEAATEIARQLRLRNIAGVIVVDFIDMESRRDQLQALEHFNKALRNDKARPQVAQLSELGLVELTRKRQGQSLYELFGRPCPTCEGLGLLTHLPGVHEEAGSLPTERTMGLGSGDFGDAQNPSEDLGDYEGGENAPASSSSVSLRDRNGGRGSLKGKGLRPAGTLNRQGRPTVRRDEGVGLGRDINGDPFPFAFVNPEPSGFAQTEPTEDSSSAEHPREKLLLRDKGERSKGPILERGRESEGDREPRQREGQRKVIVVEMTPQQQKVYSEMGLSPVLLLKPSVPLGRDTLVTVLSGSQEGVEFQAEPIADPLSSHEPEPAVTEQPTPRLRIRKQTGVPQTADLLSTSASPAPEEPEGMEFPGSEFEPSELIQTEIPSSDFSSDFSSALSPESLEPEPIVIPDKQSPAASRRRRSQPKKDS